MKAAVARTQETGKRDHNREKVTSVEGALSILELLASRNHGLSTSEISRAAKVPKSSTSYLLRTLVSRGYVRRDLETGQHTLGIRVLSLGGQAMQGMALRELAMPHLRQIVETTRLGSHLAILDHGEAVYIERIESPGFIKMDIWNGRRELAMPHLLQIVETTRLGSHLAILDHGEAVYIERIESPGFIK